MNGKTSFFFMDEKYAGCIVCVLSRVWLFATAWTVAHQAPLSARFSRQEYWSGLPFPPAGQTPDPGIKCAFLATPALVSGSFTISATSSVQFSCSVVSDSFQPTSTTIHIQNRVHRVTVIHDWSDLAHTHILKTVTSFLSDTYPEWLPGSYRSSVFNFLRTLHTVLNDDCNNV